METPLVTARSILLALSLALSVAQVSCSPEGDTPPRVVLASATWTAGFPCPSPCQSVGLHLRVRTATGADALLFHDLAFTPEDVGRTVRADAETEADFDDAVFFLTNGSVEQVIFFVVTVSGGGGNGGTEAEFFGLRTVDFQGESIQWIDMTVEELTFTPDQDGGSDSIAATVVIEVGESGPTRAPIATRP